MYLIFIIATYHLNLVTVDFGEITTKHLIFDFIITMVLVAIIVTHQKNLYVMELKEKTANFMEITVSMDLIFVMMSTKITIIILQSFTININSTILLHLNFTAMIGKTNYYLYFIMMIKITTFHL